MDSLNKYIHLTNEAVQCLGSDYGKFEEGNKLSELVFTKYWNEHIISSDKQ